WGVKEVTYYPPKGEGGIPRRLAWFFFVDPEPERRVAIMDGRLITEMRTAAVSAAATKVLASPDAKALAILGSGVQARSHVEALRLVRSVEKIRVWRPTREHAERVAREDGGTPTPPEGAVRGADVIRTA